MINDFGQLLYTSVNVIALKIVRELKILVVDALIEKSLIFDPVSLCIAFTFVKVSGGV